jgi:hypothetical protein
MADLGQAVRRDPDVLPPRNTFESVVNWLYRTITGIGGGNALFALKAGVLTSQAFCLCMMVTNRSTLTGYICSHIDPTILHQTVCGICLQCVFSYFKLPR